MLKNRLLALIVLILGLAVGYFVFSSEPSQNRVPAFLGHKAFKLGLDLSGGTHLIYKADVSSLKSGEIRDSMSALRDVIERRINLFGVSEPIIQVQEGGFVNKGEERLIVDLPGVTDIDKAIAVIGQTPLLEFKVERPEGKEKDDLIKKFQEAQEMVKQGKAPSFSADDPYFISTPLTGRFLERASLEFDQNTGEPTISLKFNKEGSDLFQKITKENIGKVVAIYLDGSPISTPVVREEISGGSAQISGNFTPKEAKTLVGRLNSGALPVPISLVSSQTIGPSLGAKAVKDGVRAGMIGFLAVALFLILWYRLPGLLAVLALVIYIAIVLSVFKLIPVTLTAAGIAAFIISIGLAVDANILIFERLKEELHSGRNISDAVQTGFSRAWFSIRDSNISSLLTAIILFWFGTSLIQGFALALGIGVLTSMFSAITISRIFLYALNVKVERPWLRFLFSSGLSK